MSACEITHNGRRYVVVDSLKRHARDDVRREQLLSRTEERLIALEARVRAGALVDPAKIGAAADRILHNSGVARCFSTKIGQGRFSWSFDAGALRYEEELLAGRYVLTTSLSKSEASTAAVVRHYLSLQRVERRFRVLKDFLALRPIYHFTEDRVRGHIALRVLAAVIEAVMGNDLTTAKVADPDLEHQTMSPRRALGLLARIRRQKIDGGGRHIELVTRCNGLQSKAAHRLWRRHLELGQSRNHLNWANARSVVETPLRRALIYLDLRN